MIVTTSQNVDGRPVTEYLRVISGETVIGVNLVKDFTAGLRDIFGGRSSSYEKEFNAARENSLSVLVDKAHQLGADAVIGVQINYQILGSNGSMLMVSASGTAVRLS